jgi:hypothetical protein
MDEILNKPQTEYIEDDISTIEEYSDIDLGVTKELSNEIINFLNNYCYECFETNRKNSFYCRVGIVP